MTHPKPSAKATEIKDFLTSSYPQLADLFKQSETLEYREPSQLSIPSAMLRIIIGQMLSAKAAETIYSRVQAKAEEDHMADWQLSFDTYRSCGMSKTKSNAIIDFASYYQENTTEVENWKNLSAEDLISAIVKHKGIGRWTATIMALFHFGHDDIFPELDGALQRVVEQIEKIYNIKIDPKLASPYQSYLAYYFWHFLDKKLIEA